MTSYRWFSFLIRFLIVGGWLVIFLGLLYIPDYWHIFSTEKAINVFAWPDSLDSHYIAQFEQETGIKINISYYESNEELLVKLKATKGRGYDLIVPSDYTVDILRKKNLLKKLDKTRMPFFKNFNPLLLNHYFDPDNSYSVPFEWAVFGIGYDKDFFGDKPPKPSWDLIFDRNIINYKIIMTNDPLVAIPIATFYLFKTLDHFDRKKLKAVEELLREQRSWVEAYSDFRADYLIATKNCPIAVSTSSYMWRGMREHPNIGFLVPEEGTLITIENFAIPITSEKEDLVYQFLEFMFKPETVVHNFDVFAFFPTVTNVLDRLTLSPEVKALLTMNKQDFSKFDFLRIENLDDGLSEQDLHDLWIAIKS
jgi:spermidine/putrescine-binding protein